MDIHYDNYPRKRHTQQIGDNGSRQSDAGGTPSRLFEFLLNTPGPRHSGRDIYFLIITLFQICTYTHHLFTWGGGSDLRVDEVYGRVKESTCQKNFREREKISLELGQFKTSPTTY